MRIRELLEAQENDVAKFFKKQQAQELKKQQIANQKNVSYYVKIHLYPELKNTIGVYWLTPAQTHYSYEDAMSVGQSEKLSANNTIRDFSEVVYRLGDYLEAAPLDRKRVEIQIPNNLQKISPEFYNGVMEWHGRVSAGNLGKLVSVKPTGPLTVAATAVKKPATAPSSPTVIKPTPDQVAQLSKQVFTTDASLSQLLRTKRNSSVDKEINSIIIDNWGEDLSVISDEIRDFLTSI